ncbi:hypothetical protein NHF46_21530 [Arthrobacter alpinus]|nr:hypothetical protein [Arthrobacter alpinus]
MFEITAVDDLAQWIARGETKSGMAGRVPEVTVASSMEERYENTKKWLGSIRDLAGVHFMEPEFLGAPGGGTFSKIPNRKLASATPCSATSLQTFTPLLALCWGTSIRPTSVRRTAHKPVRTLWACPILELSNMVALNVLLAAKGQLAGLRDVLTDWSALGLVDGFVWVEPDMVTATGISGIAVTDGNQQAVSLQSLAAGAGNYDRVRVAVLVNAGADAVQVPTETAQRVALFLESSFGGRPVTRIRAVTARIQDLETVQELAHEGWHNVVFAPEESSGVNQGHSLLYSTVDPFEIGRHAAVNCAGILGMWHGMSGSVLDHEMLLPGTNARLVRAFYRNLDATAVEAELRSQVTNVGSACRCPLAWER